MGTATGADQKRVVVQILTREGPVHDGVATIVIAPSVDGDRAGASVIDLADSKHHSTASG